jgi:hypothetical protein
MGTLETMGHTTISSITSSLAPAGIEMPQETDPRPYTDCPALLHEQSTASTSALWNKPPNMP